MSLIVQKSRDVCDHLTRHGIGFYTSGQLFLEEYYVLAMIGKAGLNTLHMYVQTRIPALVRLKRALADLRNQGW